jgi:hypothetical protein
MDSSWASGRSKKSNWTPLAVVAAVSLPAAFAAACRRVLPSALCLKLHLQRTSGETPAFPLVDAETKSFSLQTRATMSGTFGRSAGPVESRPHSLLAVNNTKYEKACAELYLANQGIEKICNFEGFANLYFLYLNNNKVRLVSANRWTAFSVTKPHALTSSPPHACGRSGLGRSPNSWASSTIFASRVSLSKTIKSRRCATRASPSYGFSSGWTCPTICSRTSRAPSSASWD